MSAIRTALLALAVAVTATAAKAHPHAWIDLDSRLIFDDQGKLEAVELHWLFDEFYTAFIAGEFTTSGLDNPSTFLQEVAAENGLRPRLQPDRRKRPRPPLRRNRANRLPLKGHPG